MKIEIRLNNPARHYRPGDMIEGEVVLRSTGPVPVESVRVEMVPAYDDLQSVDGKLSGPCTVNGKQTFPLMIRLPMRGDGADDAGWKIAVDVDGEEDSWSGSVNITVERTPAKKIGEQIGVLLFSLPALAVGALGLGFAIGGVPGKIIPVGVLWFAFVAGICALLVARAIMGSRGRDASVSWLGAPVTLVLFALGFVALYIAMVQPEFAPVKPLYRPGPIHALLSMLDGPDVRARLMSLMAAGLLFPIASGVLTRHPVSPGLQAEIALVVVSTMLAIVVLGGVVGGLATAGRVPSIAPEMWVAGLIGVISVSGAFTRPTWTAAPSVTVGAGFVPLTVGTLALYASLNPANGATMVERIVAAVMILWGVVVMYRGGRNVLVALSTAAVDVSITPTPVPVGARLVVAVAVDPRREVVLSSISGVLRCERVYSHMVGTDRRTETETVHKDRRSVQLDEQLQRGAQVQRELTFVIPVGLNPSDHSTTNGTFWSLDVKVQFAGSADWAASYPLEVVSSYG